jgi:hypothetical protein
LPILDSQPTLAFRPLEYWKPPKAVRHIRAKSSAIFSLTPSGPERHTFVHLEEPEMSFNTLSEMVGRRKNTANDHIRLADDYGQPMGAPPKYTLDREDTLGKPWYNVKSWGWKAWTAVGVVLAIIIAIVIAVAVVVTKNNKYPDYSKLNYKVVDTCTYYPALFPLCFADLL